MPHGSSFLANIGNIEIKGYLRNLTSHINANFLAYDHFILQSKVFVNLPAHILKELYESDFAFFKDRVPKEMLNHKSKELCIVPAGYPKLDMLIDYYKKNNKTSKTIIYATTDLTLPNSSLAVAVSSTAVKKFPGNLLLLWLHALSLKYAGRQEEATSAGNKFVRDILKVSSQN